MKRPLFSLGLAAGIGLSTPIFFAACATGAQEDAAPAPGGFEDIQPEAFSLTGSYERDGGVLEFDSREVAPDEFDIVVELNGMTLTAVVQRAAQVAEIDGFAAGGGDTQMLDADRELLDGFLRALAAETDVEGYAPAAMLYRVVSNWAQTPDTVPLQRQVAGSENRDFVSICAQFGAFVLATHDGNVCDAFDPACRSNAHVGDRSSSTFSFLNGRWTSTEPDHVADVPQFGECYGNCGAGCPNGNQTLSLDCHDHDQCVRNGHALASFFCNDEFVSASDDEFFAPTCAGT